MGSPLPSSRLHEEKVEELFGVAYDGDGWDPWPFSQLHMTKLAPQAVHYGSNQEHEAGWELANR